ncbi:MAG: PhzF family phenazine biosynthesis protein [Phenylobacterium sp.]|uniref:PhzF family phenazine biosynthesis protein n=1 Tax=Phenylobacterium sp. TaxID=1871053 RepID=UPI003918AEF4
MTAYRFVTLDVFTQTRFGGNPLAVFPDARGLTDAQMQALAAEFNLSETTFVLPPQDSANTARVRIFNTTAEMPFAGHPTIGTGWVLAREGFGKDGLLRLEVPAGVVEVRADADGAMIAAPKPLSTGPDIAAEVVAACAGLQPSDVRTDRHVPTFASVGNPFVIAEVSGEALGRASPDLAAFRAATAHDEDLRQRFSIYLYAREGENVRARMFAPLSGTYEDPATGSAATPLAALLLSLTDATEGRWDIVQGVEMGRPSLLRAGARRTPDGIFATVAGACVAVLRGEAEV